MMILRFQTKSTCIDLHFSANGVLRFVKVHERPKSSHLQKLRNFRHCTSMVLLWCSKLERDAIHVVTRWYLQSQILLQFSCLMNVSWHTCSILWTLKLNVVAIIVLDFNLLTNFLPASHNMMTIHSGIANCLKQRIQLFYYPFIRAVKRNWWSFQCKLAMIDNRESNNFD